MSLTTSDFETVGVDFGKPSGGTTVYAIQMNGRRDEDIAAELKAELRPHLEAIVALQNKAAKHGMQIGFQLARDQYGRNFVQTVDVVKPL